MTSVLTVQERAVVLSADEVCAILRGDQTQLRRAVTRGYNPTASKSYPFTKYAQAEDDFVVFSEPFTKRMGEPIWLYSWGNARWLRCPYGKPGDRLWVRETFFDHGDLPWEVGKCARDERIEYGASEWDRVNPNDAGGWTPATRMPRWASRITLEISDVRLERVQEISDNDALAQGIDREELKLCHVSPQMVFRRLWNSTNAQRGYEYDLNPWVWVIGFQVVSQ